MARRGTRFEPPELPPPGGVITALLRHASSPDEITIRLGRKNAGRVSEPEAERIGLGEGVEWSDRIRTAVGAAMMLADARLWASRSASRRAMSRAMLVTKLRQRGLDPGAAVRIAEDLAAKGMINEKVFAEAIAETTIARRGEGKRRIVNRLRTKGIAGRMAGEVVERVAGEAEYDERQAALDLARRKARSMSERVAPEAKARRLYGLLARRGFDADVCREVVRTVCGEAVG